MNYFNHLTLRHFNKFQKLLINIDNSRLCIDFILRNFNLKAIHFDKTRFSHKSFLIIFHFGSMNIDISRSQSKMSKIQLFILRIKLKKTRSHMKNRRFVLYENAFSRQWIGTVGKFFFFFFASAVINLLSIRGVWNKSDKLSSSRYFNNSLVHLVLLHI